MTLQISLIFWVSTSSSIQMHIMLSALKAYHKKLMTKLIEKSSSAFLWHVVGLNKMFASSLLSMYICTFFHITGLSLRFFPALKVYLHPNCIKDISGQWIPLVKSQVVLKHLSCQEKGPWSVSQANPKKLFWSTVVGRWCKFHCLAENLSRWSIYRHSPKISVQSDGC